MNPKYLELTILVEGNIPEISAIIYAELTEQGLGVKALSQMRAAIQKQSTPSSAKQSREIDAVTFLVIFEQISWTRLGSAPRL
jgi:hypothetical protein